MRYEYKLVPAPAKGDKVKGASAEMRFAAAVERILNEMAARGWEYQRTDTLPATERAGLGSTETVWRNLLVFRRPHAEDARVFHPKLLEPPAVAAPDTAPAAVAPEASDGAESLDTETIATEGVADAKPPEATVAPPATGDAGAQPMPQATVEAAQDTDVPPPPARPMRTPVGPRDAADVALRAALTGPMDDPAPRDTAAPQDTAAPEAEGPTPSEVSP